MSTMIGDHRMSTQEMITRIDALGKALSDATNEAILYAVVQPYFTDELTAAELRALADHYGSEVKTTAGSFAIDIIITGTGGKVTISARTKYGLADKGPSPKEMLRSIAETPATA